MVASFHQLLVPVGTVSMALGDMMLAELTLFSLQQIAKRNPLKSTFILYLQSRLFINLILAAVNTPHRCRINTALPPANHRLDAAAPISMHVSRRVNAFPTRGSSYTCKIFGDSVLTSGNTPDSLPEHQVLCRYPCIPR
jgi:hypothetical protein